MYDSYEMSPATARVSAPARAVGSNDADRGTVVCGVEYWSVREATGVTLAPDGGHLSLAGAIDAGFARAIRVVAEDPGFGAAIEITGGWTQEQAFMDLVGMKYNEWLRRQRSVQQGSYDDPYREMLRVAGGGNPENDLPPDALIGLMREHGFLSASVVHHFFIGSADWSRSPRRCDYRLTSAAEPW